MGLFISNPSLSILPEGLILRHGKGRGIEKSFSGKKMYFGSPTFLATSFSLGERKWRVILK